MQFLKTIFWVVIVVLLAAFAISNWTPITIILWSDLLLMTYLPVVIVAAFGLGIVPYFLLHRASKWTFRRKVAQLERQLFETRSLLDPNIEEKPPAGAISPSAAPIAVPPGVL